MDNGLQVVALDVLEIAVCAHFQFVRCRLIAYDDAVAVHLQGTDGPHLRYASFNGMMQGTRLIVPVARISTSLASITVPTPTVSAVLGTLSTSLSKKREFATIVSVVSVFTRVREVREEPGSLNAMWPSGPMPPTNRSMPPYEAQSAFHNSRTQPPSRKRSRSGYGCFPSECQYG